VKRRSAVSQFQPHDVDRVCRALNCSRAQLAARLGVSRACVSRWEKGLRAPQRADVVRLRGHAAPVSHFCTCWRETPNCAPNTRCVMPNFFLSPKTSTPGVIDSLGDWERRAEARIDYRIWRARTRHLLTTSHASAQPEQRPLLRRTFASSNRMSFDSKPGVRSATYRRSRSAIC
jgi:helix-turn-helix protein